DSIWRHLRLSPRRTVVCFPALIVTVFIARTTARLELPLRVVAARIATTRPPRNVSVAVNLTVIEHRCVLLPLHLRRRVTAAPLTRGLPTVAVPYGVGIVIAVLVAIVFPLPLCAVTRQMSVRPRSAAVIL